MLDFSSLKSAICSMQESLEVIERYQHHNGDSFQLTPEFRTFRAGVIQNFIFTYEQCWKAMRRWLAENLGKTTVDCITRKELFRLAAQYQLIDSVEPWFDYHYQRNQTSHTYEEKTASEVYAITARFLQHAINLNNQLINSVDSTPTEPASRSIFATIPIHSCHLSAENLPLR